MTSKNILHTCCFIGRRKIEESEGLTLSIRQHIERLITEERVNTFLFGSRSDFDRLCLKTVSELQKQYPHIKRIYVRAEFPFIDDTYKAYLLRSYDETYYPEAILGTGRAVYIRRNRHMIDNSRFCIVYLDEASAPRNSGTRQAVAYAKAKGAITVNIAEA
ncbi:MAG: hypothetical protein E7655_07615 [Ruminococcaceae bacterium]|nr:hypothetical protein [Oscillospiraceae bacterium]